MGYDSYKYNQTFSGTDTIAFICLPECVPICIGSLTTVSYSIFRNKKPVINIGRTNVNGFTRGSRICAGTMIFTLINQHWVRELQDSLDSMSHIKSEMKYLKNIQELKADELPIFDIMIISANEYGSWCSMYISGVDFSDEAQTISVEDLFTENVFQFVARDVSTFRKHQVLAGRSIASDLGGKEYSPDLTLKDFGVFIADGTGNDEESIFDEAARRFREKINFDNEILKKKSVPNILRNLFYDTTGLIIGDDVLRLQEVLKTVEPDVPVNGIFDETTEKLLKKVQLDLGIPSDGVVTPMAYPLLVTLVNNIVDKDKQNPDSENKHDKYVSVSSLSGAYVYEKPDLNSDINDILEYGEALRVYNYITHTHSDGGHRFGSFWETDEGYVNDNDVFSENNIVNDNIDVEPQSSIIFIRNVKNALSKLYDYLPIDNDHIDSLDIEYYKMFCEENNIEFSNDYSIDRSAYLLMLEKVGRFNPDEDHINYNFSMDFSYEPGTYEFESVIEMLEFFTGSVACGPNGINLKMTATALYANGNVSERSETLELQATDTFNFARMAQSFMYDIKEGNEPIAIEVVIYPYNRTPYKWIFKRTK